jgi:hypothetical protein
MLYPTVLRCSTVFQPIITVYAYIVKVSHDHVLLVRIYNNLMHMWHHVTNHLIISNDKDSNSENRIKLRVRDSYRCLERKCRSFQDSITRIEDQLFTADIERHICVSRLEAARALVRIQGEMQRNQQYFRLSPWSLERGRLP